MLAQAILDLFRRDVLAAPNDQILDAARDSYEAVVANARFVSRVQPAVGVDGGTRCFGVVVVPLHHVVAATA